VLDTELATVSTTEGAAYGAAVLAAVASGWFATVDDAVARLVIVTPSATPGPDVDRYAEGHLRYRALYPALAPHFHAG
jgi:xylulokinase